MKKSWDRSPYQLVTGFHLMAPVVYLVRCSAFVMPNKPQVRGSRLGFFGDFMAGCGIDGELTWYCWAFSQKPKGCNLLMCRFWSSHQRVLFSALWWILSCSCSKRVFFLDHFCRFPGQLWCETEELKEHDMYQGSRDSSFFPLSLSHTDRFSRWHWQPPSGYPIGGPEHNESHKLFGVNRKHHGKTMFVRNLTENYQMLGHSGSDVGAADEAASMVEETGWA